MRPIGALDLHTDNDSVSNSNNSAAGLASQIDLGGATSVNARRDWPRPSRSASDRLGSEFSVKFSVCGELAVGRRRGDATIM
jgi:hypothetical protein